jgi:hypothetical protein
MSCSCADELNSVRREVGITTRDIAPVNREVESVFFDVHHTQPQLDVIVVIPRRDGDPAAVISAIVGRTLFVHPLGASPIDGVTSNTRKEMYG